jgi:hypothetical protein
MGNSVYANGREIACKAGSGSSIAAFPDVCLSPPPSPAGPIPIPYPVTAQASDTNEGSKEVKISGKPVMLKDQSNFKTCSGDEAATKSLGMGVVTANITGKVFFCAWSMDVKIEGQNAVRHLDMMTHNHSSQPGQTPPWPFTDRAAMASQFKECDGVVEKAEKECTTKKGEWKKSANCPDASSVTSSFKSMTDAKDAMEKAKGAAKTTATKKYEAAKEAWKKEYVQLSKEIEENKCHQAMRCLLAPYEPGKCCPGQTGDHLVDAACFYKAGQRDVDGEQIKGCENYHGSKAPVMCVEGPNNTLATHGMMHTFKGNAAKKARDSKGNITYEEGREQGVNAAKEVFPESGCPAECLEAQLDAYHKDDKKGPQLDDDSKIRGAASGRTTDEAVAEARKTIKNSAAGGAPG